MYKYTLCLIYIHRCESVSKECEASGFCVGMVFTRIVTAGVAAVAKSLMTDDDKRKALRAFVIKFSYKSLSMSKLLLTLYIERKKGPVWHRLPSMHKSPF